MTSLHFGLLALLPALFLATRSWPETSTHHPLVTPHNTSQVVLECAPAENFIQTHMAPDFETPQLVRRLDWFHDDTLVASYQQNVVDDPSRQWWVADGRFSFTRPFYGLRIAPILPEDSGMYRCRLETDPLFALTLSTAFVELAVMVRPVAPSSPEVKAFSNRSVTLAWNHNTARAHRPIIRFSVMVRAIEDDSRFVMPAPSNATTVIVDNLSPDTLYAFAVRAENAAGHSPFGPETRFRTLGEPPTSAPAILGIRNSTEGCVSIAVEPPNMHGKLNGYHFLILRLNDNEPRREFFPGNMSGPYTICRLQPHTSYALSLEVDNGFGRSPPARQLFQTDESIPSGAPADIRVTPVIGTPSIMVHWRKPNNSGVITHYHLYHKMRGHAKWKVDHLSVTRPEQTSYKFELAGLAPSTKYHFRLSASSSKGEGQRSVEHVATTDVVVPPPPEITQLTFDCKNGITLQWTSTASHICHVELRNETNVRLFNTTALKIDIGDLTLQDEYRTRVRCSARSTVDNQTLLTGEWGQEQRFVLNQQCSYQSSVCSPNSKCLRLRDSSSSPRFSLLVAGAALFLFVVLCFLIIYSLKGKCLDIKALIKKKEKCVYLEELSPLVYDSATCDDIPVELFYGYCEDLARNDNAKYKQQFQQVELLTSCDCSEPDMLEKNLDKNRYLNIGAIEASRVRINSTTNGSDYINANYIDSCEKRNAYIATQAPLPSTFADFWEMMWQERSNIIVVITNMVEDGRRKCDQYWPSSDSTPQTHGQYQIGLVSETSNTHFVHRILTLRIAKCVPPTERRVHQLHFKGWPDHGVPDTVFPLLTFMHYVAEIHSTGPVVVHCSAGVGRSGSFILVDSMRRHLISYRKLNLMGHLIHMRRQREKLVQTVEQYMLCHEAVRQLIRHGITRVHSDLFQRYLNYLGEENVNGKTRMQVQYEDLCECRHNPVCSPPTEYITLPGYHRPDEFIVANWPKECSELWQLIWSQNCQTVVLLGEGDYWTGIEKVDDLSIQHGDNFVLLQNNEDQLCVRIVVVTRAALESDFWAEVERIQMERLAYHDAPLLIINPIRPETISSSSPRISSEGAQPLMLNHVNHVTSNSSTLSLSMIYNGEPSPSLAYCLCALTSLACQLEQQGCVDVVLLLSSYSHIHCGLWSSRQDIEMIYEKMAILVNTSRV
ncbi:unnamed protein product [Cylicocyclus nassatus]|uniref:protein-tyrosine-phosphatase n=1 Tax=Cylicocyclus nassatus TaxID=53992 RepID=A0AA36H3J8_CYLNA|nr:unnamed protein product [Cylicocyclus nassatus]